MKTVTILIDFDNIFPKVISEYQNGEIETTITKVKDKVLLDYPEIENIVIRFYGGWYTGKVLTSRASSIASMIPSLQGIFPIHFPSSRLVHGNIELASQLYSSAYVWYDSYREHKGLPKLRIDHNVMGTTCSTSSEHCPVKILKKFVEKKNRICSNTGCSTMHSQVFFERTQKYVDTMMACDVICMSMEEDIEAIYVFSDDVDIFPSFAVSSSLTMTPTHLHLLILNDQNEKNYQNLLNNFGVNVSLLMI